MLTLSCVLPSVQGTSKLEREGQEERDAARARSQEEAGKILHRESCRVEEEAGKRFRIEAWRVAFHGGWRVSLCRPHYGL